MRGGYLDIFARVGYGLSHLVIDPPSDEIGKGTGERNLAPYRHPSGYAYHIGLCHPALDEAARVSDEVYLALRPSVAVSKGDILLASTPKGKRGFFYREMTDMDRADGEKWLRHTGPVTECARVPEEHLVEERARGEAYFNQEYLNLFVETGEYLFDEDLVASLVKSGLEVWPCTS